MDHGGCERAFADSVRQFDGKDHVVESAHMSGRLRRNGTALGINDYVVRFDADLMQHRSHKRYFVLAVTVMVREHFRGRMRLPASDPQLNRYVTDIPLRKLSKGLHLRGWSARGSRQLRRLLFQFRRGIPPSTGQPLVPNPHLLPILKSLVLRDTS